MRELPNEATHYHLGSINHDRRKVISASSHGSINGVPIALEGDLIFCPACKSQGKIRCVEPRIPEMWNGKKVALENDLCICGCPTPPRLVPNQSLRCQVLRDDNEGSASAHSNADASRGAATGLTFDDRFILFDEDTGESLPNIEYAIQRANGKIEFGTTDEKGYTHLLTAAVRAESVEIYL